MAGPPASKKRKTTNTSVMNPTVRRDVAEGPSYGSDVVRVRVGSDTNHRIFTVHKDLLVKHSDFFKAALKKDWKEGKEAVIPMPEDQPEYFELFNRFLYTGQIFSAKNGDFQPKDNGAQIDREWSLLIGSWVFGDKVLSPSFKDALIDALVSKIVNTGRYLTRAEYIYHKSTSGSAIRRLIVDIAIYKWSEKDMAQVNPNPDNMAFLHDGAVALKKLQKSGGRSTAPFEGEDACVYHEHDANGQPCYRTMFH